MAARRREGEHVCGGSARLPVTTTEAPVLLM
jgi:hypothetical protein